MRLPAIALVRAALTRLSYSKADTARLFFASGACGPKYYQRSNRVGIMDIIVSMGWIKAQCPEAYPTFLAAVLTGELTLYGE